MAATGSSGSGVSWGPIPPSSLGGPRLRTWLRQDDPMSLPSLTAAENGFRQLWRRPRYPGFVMTVSLARTTGFMFNTAGVLLVLERTGSAPLAGVTAAAAVVPSALTGPILGAWLDVAHPR